MNKNDLLKYEDDIVRILDIKDDKVLVINVTKKNMPKWVPKSHFSKYEVCQPESVLESLSDKIDLQSKRITHERYTVISNILPFISCKTRRNQLINEAAVNNSISKQTVRNYLYKYLVYQDILALAPRQNKEKELSKDEKNMRWALNKFYYTKHKNSLNTTYTMMLKAKYCDTQGNLLPEYPSIHQFKYFYRKNMKLQTYYISRDGIKNYQRNNRPLLGEGIHEFAPSIGTAMLDSTICDIYLVNDTGNLVGRPILTACIDAYSGLCCGYYLSWEGGVFSIKNLLLNTITDKVQYCKDFGITIEKETWNCNQLPAVLVTDMGTEYKSDTFAQIAELGVAVINLPSYRPELKGRVEKFFDLIQSLYKKNLKGYGVVDTDYRERGAHDYRKDACLTIHDFEKIILYCIVYYNSKRIIENFPYTEDMIENNIQPYSNEIWNYGLSQAGANLIDIDSDTLILTLLPRTIGKFCRDGLKVNKLRYKHDDYTEQYLKGGEVTVAYNPDNVSDVWLFEKEKYVKFELIESRFKNKNLSEIDNLKKKQKDIIKSVTITNLQAQIDLSEHIETIAKSSINHNQPNIKNVRNTRNKEKIKEKGSVILNV